MAEPWSRKEVIGSAVLYCGDCAEIVPLLPRVDAVVTDPPYGIGSWSATGGNSISEIEAADANKWDVAPDEDVFDLLRSVSKHQIFWGGNYFIKSLGNCRSPLIWDKKQRGVHFADGEFAWTSFKTGTLRIYDRSIQSTDIRQVKRQHPTQKPIGLMEWCLGFVPDAEVILDPFMGSGTTGVACAKIGRRFIGIEREAKYFEIACARLAEAYSQPTLFVSAPSIPIQEPLFGEVA